MSDLRVASVAAPLRKQVVKTISKAIADGVWQPGDRLVERELCEQTGVSRTLMREALRQLETEGLVEAVPNKGLLVAKITIKEASDLYAVRATLEAMAGHIVAQNASDKVKLKLRKLLDDLSFAIKTDDFKAAVDIKSSFYSLIFEASGNTLLCEMLENLHTRTALLRSKTLSAPGRAAKSVKDIAKIVRAIEMNDGDAAAEACRDHVISAASVAIGILSSDVD